MTSRRGRDRNIGVDSTSFCAYFRENLPAAIASGSILDVSIRACSVSYQLLAQ